MIISKNNIDHIELLSGENDYIKFQVAPVIGGRIVSVFNKVLQKEFLWHNEKLPLDVNKQGADYDSNFWGGIDELIPNDIPEMIDSISYPDHGELWTAPLEYDCMDDKISVYGKLKLSGLYYKKTMHLNAESPVIFLEYKIRNESGIRRNFLWKLHAALAIEEGNKLVSNARKAKAVYPERSRVNFDREFDWPQVDELDVSAVPPFNNTMDFFYLYDMQEAEMGLANDQADHVFRYSYDKKVFPYQWYFASYGGFLNHYTAILEPATNMPVSVKEAMVLGQCAVLEPDSEINTVVRIYAGKNN